MGTEIGGFFSSHIIAILASILFPVFARAREKARQSSCLSNMKQIGLAVMSYAQDYDECLPMSWVDVDASTDGTNGVDYTWRSAVLPYAKNAQIWQCPSKKMTGVFDGGMDLGEAAAYGINEVHWLNTVAAAEPPAGKGLGDIQYPSQCILLGETTSSQSFSNTDGLDTHGYVFNGATRHNDGANFAYCDGHCKWQKPNGIKCAVGNCEWSITGN